MQTPVPPEFPEDMERAGFIEATPTTGRERNEDPFWYEKYGNWDPPFMWTLTDAGRAALQAEDKP